MHAQACVCWWKYKILCTQGFETSKSNFWHTRGFANTSMNVMDGTKGGTTSAPISAHRLILDKVQELRSGILTYTSLVLLQMKVEKRVKVFIARKFYLARGILKPKKIEKRWLTVLRTTIVYDILWCFGRFCENTLIVTIQPWWLSGLMHCQIQVDRL